MYEYTERISGEGKVSVEQAAVSQPAMHHLLVDVNSPGRYMMNVEDTRLARVLWQGSERKSGRQ